MFVEKGSAMAFILEQIERLNIRVDSLMMHLYELEHKIRPLVAEYIEPKVLELLRSEKAPRRVDYFTGRFELEAGDALESLVKKGLATKVRSGTNWMYAAKES